jgi:hypothetical protein
MSYWLALNQSKNEEFEVVRVKLLGAFVDVDRVVNVYDVTF